MVDFITNPQSNDSGSNGGITPFDELQTWAQLVKNETGKRVRAARFYGGNKLTDTDKVVYNALTVYAFRIGKQGMSKYNCKEGWHTKAGKYQVASACGKEVDEAEKTLRHLQEINLIHIVRHDGDFNNPSTCPLIALQMAKIKKSDVRNGTTGELVLEDGWSNADTKTPQIEQQGSITIPDLVLSSDWKWSDHKMAGGLQELTRNNNYAWGSWNRIKMIEKWHYAGRDLGWSYCTVGGKPLIERLRSAMDNVAIEKLRERYLFPSILKKKDKWSMRWPDNPWKAYNELKWLLENADR